MNPDEYQRLTHVTMNKSLTPKERLMNCALGMTGEAGEFADTIKKHFFHGHPLDLGELLKELGDEMWYISEACNATGLKLSDVMEQNIEKLRKRYPEGFSEERSINR